MWLTVNPGCSQTADRNNPYRLVAEFRSANEVDILNIFSAVFDHEISRGWRSLRRQAGKVDIVQIAAPTLVKVIVEDRRRLSTYHRAGRGRSEERRVGKECRSRWSPY